MPEGFTAQKLSSNQGSSLVRKLVAEYYTKGILVCYAPLKGDLRKNNAGAGQPWAVLICALRRMHLF